MKLAARLLGLLPLLLIPTLLQAAPLGMAHSPEEYAISTEPLRPWSCGLIYERIDRELKNGTDATYTHQMAYIGYDILRWVRWYGAVGVIDSNFGYTSSDDNNGRYMTGLRFNLIDHEVADPGLMEDRVGLTASFDYASGDVAYPSRDETTTLEEMTASLHLSIVNEVMSDKRFSPESVTAYFGPVFSDLSSDHKNLDERDNVGYSIGMDFLYTPSVSVSIMFVKFEELGLSGGFHVSF